MVRAPEARNAEIKAAQRNRLKYSKNHKRRWGASQAKKGQKRERKREKERETERDRQRERVSKQKIHSNTLSIHYLRHNEEQQEIKERRKRKGERP